MQSQFQMNFKSISGDSHVKAFAPGGELVYVHDWMDSLEADRVLASLREQIGWQSRTIRMFGREVMQPRKIAFQGDPEIAYSYSGSLWEAAPWQRDVAALRRALEAQTGENFNCVLLNLYRNGRDSMGWHSDDEPELGRDPVIASVSLGAERRFVLRRKSDGRCRFELAPAHGSLILMRGDMQAHWQHQVPKTARAVGPRVNLTFRRILHSRRDSAARCP
ncbi:MAG: alpha-ketoglutarate-dependent dioxygenase AlkB [Wenzhouxiangellaceae bacterium]|nr:alpha-ketoglutarate-dependent dioxygenase AlkB [Wenzhouxiangellaceae bacterium]